MLNKWFKTGSGKCSAPKLTGGVSVLDGLSAIAVYDLVQKRSWVLRNYPFLGHARYAVFKIRPEIQQYFIERDWDGRPFDYTSRHLIYARARDEQGEASFAALHDVTADGKEWFVHSMKPMDPPETVPKARVGGDDLKWELGTANFGARRADGRLDAKEFADKAAHEAVKTISPKPRPGQLLSQSHQAWLVDWQQADPHAFGYSRDAMEHNVSRY